MMEDILYNIIEINYNLFYKINKNFIHIFIMYYITNIL